LHDREAELQPRVDRRRVGIITLAPGNRREALEAFEVFAREVSALRFPGTSESELETACEPVPIKELTT
jgi:hypothetical protein